MDVDSTARPGEFEVFEVSERPEPPPHAEQMAETPDTGGMNRDHDPDAGTYWWDTWWRDTCKAARAAGTARSREEIEGEATTAYRRWEALRDNGGSKVAPAATQHAKETYFRLEAELDAALQRDHAAAAGGER